MNPNATKLNRIARQATAATVLGLGMAVSVSSLSGATEKLEWTVDQVNNMSCKEFLETKEVARPGLVYWVDGYRHHGKGGTIVRQDWFEYPVDQIVTECKSTPEAKLVTVVEAHSNKHHTKS